MVEGNLAIAASRKGGLLVRTDPDEADEVLARPGVSPMEQNGVAKPAWIWVDPAALGGEEEITAWVDRALAFIETLPPK